MTVLDSIVLGPIANLEAGDGHFNGWYNDATNNGSFNIEGSLVDSVARTTACGGVSTERGPSGESTPHLHRLSRSL